MTETTGEAERERDSVRETAGERQRVGGRENTVLRGRTNVCEREHESARENERENTRVRRRTSEKENE